MHNQFLFLFLLLFRLQPKASEEHAAKCIAKFDKDGSGTLGFNEFVHVLTDGEIDLVSNAAEVSEGGEGAALFFKTHFFMGI